jgi:sulfur relay (sulfurtransferase) complex TusBCD TusD component (DsrE family)
VETPDFAHLQQLQECLLETGVQLDYYALCLERRGSEQELQACLDRLVSTQNFMQALKFARTAGLPRDAVVMAQVCFFFNL